MESRAVIPVDVLAEYIDSDDPAVAERLAAMRAYCEEHVTDTLDLSDVKIDVTGFTAPPKDMMEAAQRSLSPEAFAQLMERTGGKAPTPAELCAFADAERELALTPAELASEAADEDQAQWESEQRASHPYPPN